MDIYEVRSEMKRTGRSLFDMPLRVAYYARVSTDSGEQLNSLGNQTGYYEDFILQNPNWEFAGAYVDEGLSGITTMRRENFHAMVADARAGRFDFVVTKEISRFARNTLDSIRYTRELLASGVAVWFQQDSINTIDDDSELRLSIMSSLAQEESRRLSSRVRFGHAQAIKNGVVMGNSRIYGYDKVDGRLVVNEREAEMVRLVFELYATGDYSTPKIERILNERGYRNFNGGTINRNVLRKVITNPKYKGFYCGNKVKVVDMFTKKQKFLGEDEWEMYRDHDKVPPIVDEELWERANVIFAKRSEDMKSRRASHKTDNLFTGKILCTEHEVPFYKKSHGTWVCSHRIKNGKDSCNTFGIKESELVQILNDTLSVLSSTADELVAQYIQFLGNVEHRVEDTSHIAGEIAKIAAKKEKLLELNMDGSLSNAEFKQRNNALNAQTAALKKQVAKKPKTKTPNLSEFKNRLLEYMEAPAKELSHGIINSLIDKISVTPNPNNMGLALDIILNTGEGRSGDIFKKMIEAQERHMAGQTPQ